MVREERFNRSGETNDMTLRLAGRECDVVGI